MGLVLNRPMEGLSFDDLLKQLDLEPVPAQRSIRLHQGGPQEGGRGFVLHTNDWSSEGSLQVGGDLALTASVDILKAIADIYGFKRTLARAADEANTTPSASAQVATTAHSPASAPRGMSAATPGIQVSTASTATNVPRAMASEPSRLLSSPPSVA